MKMQKENDVTKKDFQNWILESEEETDGKCNESTGDRSK